MIWAIASVILCILNLVEAVNSVVAITAESDQLEQKFIVNVMIRNVVYVNSWLLLTAFTNPTRPGNHLFPF
jgi:hypothetical protein